MSNANPEVSQLCVVDREDAAPAAEPVGPQAAGGASMESAGAWSPDQLWSIIDNLKGIVFQTDAEGRWTFLNRAWEEITGFSVAESLGKVFFEFVHPDDRELNQQRFEPLIERKKEYCRHEIRYLTRDGGFRWIEVHARLTLDGAGRIVGTSGTLHDISERRRASDELREARQKLELILASTPVAIFVGQPGHEGVPWQTTYMSDNIRAVTGHPPEAFMGDPGFWLRTLHPDDLADAYSSFADIEAHGRATFRARSLCPDGSYRWVRCDVRLAPGAAGGTPHAFGCVVDETHTRTIEESLRRHAAILEAVGFAARRFLEAASWRGEIDAVLERIGVAARASRVYVFENHRGAGRDLLTTQRFEWTAEGIPAQLGRPELEGLSYRESGFERWVDVLGRGEPVWGRVAEFPTAERAALDSQGIQSLVVVPIFTGGDWWGFIGFDDCGASREWSATEVEALRAAAGLLGSAIRREQTESALRYSEALLRTMTDASPLGFYVVDNRSDRVLYSNDRFCEIWGIEPLRDRLRSGRLANKEVVGHCAPLIADPDAFAATCRPLQDEANRVEVADHIAFRDGRTIRRFSTQIRDTADHYFGRLYLFEDVTDQRRAEDTLRRSHAELETRVQERTADLESLNERLRAEVVQRREAQQALADREARFRTLIENAWDVIFIVDPETTIEYVSPTVTRVLGYEPHEVVGRHATDFFDRRDVPGILTRFRREMRLPGSHTPIELRIRHKDGSTLLAEATGNNQLDNPAVGGFVVTLRDIRARRHLEEQFQQAQKMEAIGTLAGGVAHDFNNLLTVISGYGELVDGRLPEGDPLHRQIAQIRKASDRAADLVRKLLAFSRKQDVRPATVDANEAVGEVDKMLRRLIGENIDLTVARAPEAAYVHVDRTQLEQIIMNLSVNARDAMPAGGDLSIGVDVRQACRKCQCPDRPPGLNECVSLTVRDTGQGMSEETKAHIFEPFFTTKDVGQGTGLGLSMVYGAVKQAGGCITVKSDVGQGTAFRICLPRIPAPETAAPNAPPPQETQGGRETVLLVEDEALLRAMLSDALRHAGYRVLEARHGEEAWDIVRRGQVPIDLLLTDMVMPRMGGRELAEHVAAVAPDMAVLYMSGHTKHELAPGTHLLKKPFTPATLVSEVRSAIERAS